MKCVEQPNASPPFADREPGKVLRERSVIVSVGTLMFFEDPEGNVFGAMQYDDRAE